MLRHPEAQRKAQEEIDRVVGRNRLPDFSDRESLPFVECMMQETFRLYHPIPLGAYKTLLFCLSTHRGCRSQEFLIVQGPMIPTKGCLFQRAPSSLLIQCTILNCCYAYICLIIVTLDLWFWTKTSIPILMNSSQKDIYQNPSEVGNHTQGICLASDAGK